MPKIILGVPRMIQESAQQNVPMALRVAWASVQTAPKIHMKRNVGLIVVKAICSVVRGMMIDIVIGTIII